ncbi:MAG: DNA polymerase III subunit delta' [Desulfobacterales bacterium]
MPGFDAIIGQTRPIRILTRLLARGTLPHALLFTGIEGVGKKTAATAVVMACNCTGAGRGMEGGGRGRPGPAAMVCGECAPCRKIKTRTHPDVRQMAPDRGMIKIDQIRELCGFLGMKPHEARTRAVVIADAHTMNPAAANALLKMLEEPPPQTVLILTAVQATDLLPTVVSRCRQVHFSPIPRQELAAILVRNLDLSPGEADVAAALAGGSVTRAMAIQSGQGLRRRNWLMAQLSGLSRQTPLGLLALAEKLARERAELTSDLDLVAVWLRDAAVARHCPEKMIHADVRGPIQDAAGLREEALGESISALQEAARSLRANANPRLTLEALFIRLADSLRPEGQGPLRGAPNGEWN